MAVYAPDYYPLFRCAAGKCMHTCCAGWEIDIDENSMRRFQTLSGPVAEKLRAGIVPGNPPRFALTPEGRCPMLRADGLCDLILTYGEGALCGICADHPRFRNFWTGRTEIGLGMVCETAARLILSRPEPMRLIRLSGGPEEALPPEEAALMKVRDRFLASVRQTGPSGRLMEYLIYRHIADALYDHRLMERIAFVKQSHRELTANWDGRTESLAEAARRFSDEVEYDSDELERRISGALTNGGNR